MTHTNQKPKSWSWLGFDQISENEIVQFHLTLGLKTAFIYCMSVSFTVKLKYSTLTQEKEEKHILTGGGL